MPRGPGKPNLIRASIANFVSNQLQVKSQPAKYAFYNDELLNAKAAEEAALVNQDELVDDAVLDDYKVMMHLSEMERMADNFQQFVADKH